MTSVLKRAVVENVLGHRDKIKVKMSKLKIWNENIERALKRSKYIKWEWKKCGSPTDVCSRFIECTEKRS